MERFAGKTVLVTGGGYGIGRSVALRFASEGAKVGVLDLDQERADETVKLVVRSGRAALAVKTDVSDSADVNRAVREVSAKLETGRKTGQARAE